MKVLAVDTSALVATVAVTEDNKLLGEYILNHRKTHSQKLMPMIEEVLESLEIKPQDIDVYAASSGPGSFTGLRIGITTVKALAYALKKPVVSVPTLDALAYNVPVTDSLICPIMDARNDQVFTGIYEWDGKCQSRLADNMAVHISELIKIIKEKNIKTVFVGDAVELHSRLLKNELGDMCMFAPPNLLVQRASSVAFLAYERALSGNLESSFDMVPFYLRKSQAEREYELKCRNDNACI